MNESVYVVGIDVSKRKLDLALLLNGKIKSKVFENTPAGHRALQHWLTERGAMPASTHICMESTGPYSEPVALTLADAGWTVSVVNPLRIKGFGQSELSRNKTDAIDAALIARFCVALNPEPWTPPPVHFRKLRALVDRLQALKDMQQQERNRLEASVVEPAVNVVASLANHLDWLAEEIELLERDIDDHLDNHPDLRQDVELMTSIPGIGDKTAAKVLAYIGDVRRFASAKALAAFVGVAPRIRQSGSSVRGRSSLGRSGHGAARAALYMPGMVALKHNPALKAFGDRLRDQGLAPKAVVGAAMRKLVHLIYGVLRSRMPFDVRLAMPALDFQDGN